MADHIGRQDFTAPSMGWLHQLCSYGCAVRHQNASYTIFLLRNIELHILKIL
jgi:hypothetical protein